MSGPKSLRGFFFVFVLILPSFVCASEVVLKSGLKVEGKIVDRTDKSISVDSGVGVATTYYDDEIDTVDGQKIQGMNSSSPSDADQAGSEKSLGSVSIGDKTILIIDSFAVYLNHDSASPELHTYFFSKPLTHKYKQSIWEKVKANPSFLDITDDVLELKLDVKKGDQVCSKDSIVVSGVVVRDSKFPSGYISLGISPEVIGLKKFSCAQDEKSIDVAFKNNTDRYKIFFTVMTQPNNQKDVISWDINLESQLLAEDSQADINPAGEIQSQMQNVVQKELKT